MVTFELFANTIDGVQKSTTSTRHGINPATLEVLPPVPVSTPEDVDHAVAAAARGAADWAQISIDTRRDAVSRYADALATHSNDFVSMLTREQGKLVRDASLAHPAL